VIALDGRGHARGMRSTEPFTLEDCADDAAAPLDQIAVDRVIIVGYPMGGPVGMLLARRHPGRVKALVMHATALEWRDAAHERMAWHLSQRRSWSWSSGWGPAPTSLNASFARQPPGW
jgi:3-oxoadipate enol-lactonase